MLKLQFYWGKLGFRGMIYGTVGCRGSSSSRVVGPSPAPPFSRFEPFFFPSTLPTGRAQQEKRGGSTQGPTGSSQNTGIRAGSSQNTGIRGVPAPRELGFPEAAKAPSPQTEPKPLPHLREPPSSNSPGKDGTAGESSIKIPTVL